MKVTHEEWEEKASNFQKRIKDNPYPANLQWYRDILARIHIGKEVLDVGAGDNHVQKVLPPDVIYYAIDSHPRNDLTIQATAEELINVRAASFDTVICFAALDNLQDLDLALKGFKHVANHNIAIVTGINIPADELHTLMITREALVAVLGEPRIEQELLTNVFLFEWMI